VFWFGFRERHTVRVAACPVTDVANGQKPGNALDVSAVRWRLTPLPWFLMVPLTLLVLILLGSSPSEFDTVNTFDGQGVRFMLGSDVAEGSVNMQVRARWSAPWYAWLKMSKNDNEGSLEVSSSQRTSFTDSVDVSNYGSDRLITYNVASAVTSGGQSLSVRFVPLRTTDAVSIAPLAGGAFSRSATTEPYPNSKSGEAHGQEYTLTLPRDGSWVSARFANTSPERFGLSVVFWLAKSSPSFEMMGLTVGERSREIPAQNSIPVKFRYRGDAAESAEDEIWLLTTDKTHQFIRIKLRTP
jgi:hypothetical protein